MRKIIVSMMMSVDGYIQGRDPEENWHNWNEEMDAYMKDFFSTVDTFIYGRKSYEEMIAYWPGRSDDFAVIMNETPKMIFSKTLGSVTWNSTLYRRIDPKEIDALKKQEGKNMVIFAGSNLLNSFMQHGLVDEFRLIINPLLLGTGKSYFLEMDQSTPLRLIHVHQFACGNVLLTYQP